MHTCRAQVVPGCTGVTRPQTIASRCRSDMETGEFREFRATKKQSCSWARSIVCLGHAWAGRNLQATGPTSIEKGEPRPERFVFGDDGGLEERAGAIMRMPTPRPTRAAPTAHTAAGLQRQAHPLGAQGDAPRGVLEERRHSPFQVLDASAIEGFRGLAGESSSIYSCIQIYKALTPPPPPAYRGATEGPRPPSYVGSSEERPCPDRGLCAPPSAPADAGAAVGGWALPPPDDCTCRVKPRLKSPPPRGGRRAAAFLRCAGRP